MNDKGNLLTNQQQLFENAIRDGSIHPEDGRLAREFVQKYNAQKSNSPGSVAKYYYTTKAFLVQLKAQGRTIATLDEDGTYALFEWLRRSKWSEHSKLGYWKSFARLYKWAAKRYGAEWPPRTKELLYSGDATERLQYKLDKARVKKKSTFTAQEVLELLQNEPSLHHKALYAVLFDSGMRGGEAFSIRIRGVKRDRGGVLTLQMEKSKTRIRPVVLEPGVSIGVTYLDAYLRQHPRKDDPGAPLFLNRHGEPLTVFAANKNLKQLVQRVARAQTDPERRKAWLAKDKVSLHSFRHSRATDLANKGLNESLMAELLGWSPGSLMPKTYIREAQLDAQAALRRVYGVEKPEEKAAENKRCPGCLTPNPLANDYCDLCRQPFPEFKARRDAEEREKLAEALDKMLGARFAQYEEKIAKLAESAGKT